MYEKIYKHVYALFAAGSASFSPLVLSLPTFSAFFFFFGFLLFRTWPEPVRASPPTGPCTGLGRRNK